MRPTRFELATFGLKDRRSLGPRRDPLTTELRALGFGTIAARGVLSVAGAEAGLLRWVAAQALGRCMRATS